MVKKELKKIFLSASTPYPYRDKKYYNTADIVAIRDAVRALATVVVPSAHLIWGGHPAITPLIRQILEVLHTDPAEHITLYQSAYYKKLFPADNNYFEKIIIVPEANDINSSLYNMRYEMLNRSRFAVGIFIGGMEGVIEEHKMFTKAQPDAIVLPIASTGAAAKIIYDSSPSDFDSRLLNDYAYMALFRDFLKDTLQ